MAGKLDGLKGRLMFYFREIRIGTSLEKLVDAGDIECCRGIVSCDVHGLLKGYLKEYYLTIMISINRSLCG
jgi:hypothetical protein